MKEMNTPTDRMTSRRSLLKGAVGGAAAVGLGALLGAMPTLGADSDDSRLTAGDVAILRFLAAAEFIETDLWDQYCELAVGNKMYGNALNKIEGELVIYTCDVADDERSHEQFINGFLVDNGHAPVNLDAFRTLPSSKATGAKQIGRLTNLMNITVDTSWYLRYRSTGNPDFGDTFPQFVNIVNKPVIPLHDHYSEKAMQLIASSAAFHFAAVEQGGASIYPTMIPKASNLDVLRILTGIGPSETYFFASFHQSLEGIPAISGDGLVFPDVTVNDIGAHHIPHPCEFIERGLPLACVIRPTTTPFGGASVLFENGVRSGLYKGQSQHFFDTLRGLAAAADAARRTC